MTATKTLASFEADYNKSPEGRERISQLKRQIGFLGGGSKAVRVPCDMEAIFGLISCTHIGSAYANLKGLEAFYSEAKRLGASVVLHCGDVCDGAKMYKGQEYEQTDIGWEAQAKRFESVAPDVLPTQFITGNHDESLKKLAGMAPGPDLARRRPDWTYLGESYGRVMFDAGGDRKCLVDLMHPGGGTSYAISYRLQKIIEQLEGGTKPDLLGVGHYHKAEWLPSYRNISGIQAGTFQWQTPFMRDHALAAHVGGWVVRVRIGNNCNVFSATFVAFYR